MRFAICCLLLILASPVSAAAPSVVSLGNIKLGMPKAALVAKFGEPMDVRRMEDGSEHYIFGLDRESGAHMVASFTSAWPNNVAGIQISSGKAADVDLLHGLKLGSSADEVREAIGAPNHTRQAGIGNRQLWQYADRNYSFEISPAVGLLSARISSFDGYWRTRGFPVSFEDYRPANLSFAVERFREATRQTGDIPDNSFDSLPRPMLLVGHSGPEMTAVPAAAEDFLEKWFVSIERPSSINFSKMVSFKESGEEFQVLMQDTLHEAWRKEVSRGQYVLLFGLMIGVQGPDMKPVVIANEFRALPWRAAKSTGSKISAE